MIGVLALACSAPPEKSARSQDQLRGCSAVATLSWESSDPNLETYVDEFQYDEYGWLVEDRYDSSFDQNDSHIASIVRPDGQSEVTTYYFGVSDNIEYELFSSYGGDALVDREELVWGDYQTLVGRNTYTNSGGVRQSVVIETEGSYRGGPLEFYRRDDYFYDVLGRPIYIEQSFFYDEEPSRIAINSYLGTSELLTGYHVLLTGSQWPLVSREYEYDHQGRITWGSEVDEMQPTAFELSYSYDDPDDQWETASYYYLDLMYDQVYRTDELTATRDEAGRPVHIDIHRSWLGSVESVGEISVDWTCDDDGRR